MTWRRLHELDEAKRLEEWDHTAQIIAMVAATGGVTLELEKLNPIRRAREEKKGTSRPRLIKPSEIEI